MGIPSFAKGFCTHNSPGTQKFLHQQIASSKIIYIFATNCNQQRRYPPLRATFSKKFCTVKKKTFLLATCLASLTGTAATPLWLRNCAISPDGSTVAFTYKGDIYTVPVNGGKAFQLTSNPGYDTRPTWSPDGQSIAFSSNRENGDFDVYIVAATGGVPRRLTTHSANEYVETFKDAHTILYSAYIQPDAADGVFPSSLFTQVYEVNVEGGRPRMFSSLTMESLSVNTRGQILYQDKKGYEDTWRKHHTSAITRDIWMAQDDQNGKRTYKRMTSFKGEDRNPVWAADGQSYYYLNEENGSMNVYKTNLAGDKRIQLTTLTKNPVRYLSASHNGTLCFSYDGEIYTLKEGGKPQKINIQIIGDNAESAGRKSHIRWGAGNLSLAPSEKEVAFITAGDVYVTSTDYETTKRITATTAVERSVDMSPDGRSLVYASERNGVWGIYMTSLVRQSDKNFTYAHELKEEPLVTGKEACFMPKFSPDGKEVAFLANRTELRIINLKSKKIRTVLPGEYNFSYTDYDQDFQWSPDSKWLLSGYMANGGWNNRDVALVSADGKKVVNLTQSGYSDGGAKWVLDGKAMIWSSDRSGYRSHGSWGAQNDVYIMFFDEEAYDKFRMSKEERSLLEEQEKLEKEEAEKAKDKEKNQKNKKDKDKKPESKEDKTEVEELVLDLENCRDRVIRLTGNSSNLADYYLSNDGRKLYYEAAFEGGYDLWVHDLDDRSTRILSKGFGSGELIADKAGKNFYIASGTIRKVNMENGRATNIPFVAETDNSPAAEREYVFDHVQGLIRDKFYVKDYGGVDWNGYCQIYRRFLPHINNGFDMAEMLSELLGELNASHTGARYGTGTNNPTASLGAFYDEQYHGDGLRIREIIKQGPLDKAQSKIKEGYIITHIDGQKIEKGKDYYPLLARKAGVRVLLTVTDEKGKNSFEQEVKPISYGAQTELLYKRWVEQREKLTDEYSKGKIGYVHIKGMDSPSFRKTYSDMLGKFRTRDAMVVDVRHNGGGWLHEDLAVLLTGKEFQRFEPRGQYVGSDPFNRWLKPSAMLVCEDCYSNASGVPFMYKYLGIGKLVGTPVAGTMTAVWWEGQAYGGLVVGVPQVAIKDMSGKYLENQEIEPDILIYATPEEQLSGNDVQLKKTIDHLLEVTHQ